MSASSVTTIGVSTTASAEFSAWNLPGSASNTRRYRSPRRPAAAAATSPVSSVEPLSARSTVTAPPYFESATRSSVFSMDASSLRAAISTVTGGH